MYNFCPCLVSEENDAAIRSTKYGIKTIPTVQLPDKNQTTFKNDHQDPCIQPAIHNYAPHLQSAQQYDHHASAQQFEHNSSAQIFNHHASNLQPAAHKKDYQDTLNPPLVQLVEHNYHAVHQDEDHTLEQHHASYLQTTAQPQNCYIQPAGQQDYNGNFATAQQINSHSSHIKSVIKHVDHQDSCIQSVVQFIDHNYFAPPATQQVYNHHAYIQPSVQLMDTERYAPPLQPVAQQVNHHVPAQTFNHHASNLKSGAQEVDHEDHCIQSVLPLIDHNYFAPPVSPQVDIHSVEHHFPYIKPSGQLINDDNCAPTLQPAAQQVNNHAPAQPFNHHASNLKSGAAQEVVNHDPHIQPAVQLVDHDAPYITSNTKQDDKQVTHNSLKEVKSPDHYIQPAVRDNLKGSMPLKISKGSQTRQKKV